MFLSKRNGVYYLWYEDENGRRQKVSTRSKVKRVALAFVRTFQPHASPPVKMSLTQFAEEYLQYARSSFRPGTTELAQRALGHLIARTGDCMLRAVTTRQIDLFKAQRLNEASATTVSMELRSLRSMFSTAIKWDLISSNPCSQVELPRIPQTSPIYLTREEYQRLMSAIVVDWLKELVEFAVLTGMRRGEILNLRWRQVDLERKVIVVQSDPTFKGKTGKLRVVPLSERACHILLSKIRHAPDNYVFTFEDRKFKGDHVIRNFRKAVRCAGLPPKLNFHSLRHTHASWLVQAGVSIYRVSKVLGHSSVEVTQKHYASLEASELHGAVHRINLDVIPEIGSNPPDQAP